MDSTAETNASATAGADRRECRLYRTDEDMSSKWPIVYSPNYNISFMYMEKLHPFDSGKWGRIFGMLKDEKMVAGIDDVVAPQEITDNELREVHTDEYLDSLRWSSNVARITEVPPAAIVPNFILRRVLLSPLRLQTGGTVLAGRLAVEHGWSINIGGGFHHCSGSEGGGFCAYADITLCIKAMQENLFADDENKHVLIVDLDAHQGNGYANDVREDRLDKVSIMDMYNKHIYPQDHRAETQITEPVPLGMFTADREYLRLLKRHLPQVLSSSRPRAIIYNAGTDILEGDRLGCLSVTADGISERDAIVFQAAKEEKIPIVMLTSGGYQQVTARVIANSLLNLWKAGIIDKNVVGQR